MNPLKADKGYQSRVRANSQRLYRWAGAWMAAMVLTVKVISGHKTWVFALPAGGLDVAVGIGLILTMKKFIAEADELQRNLLLNAFAIAFGVGVVLGVPWAAMSAFRVIPFKANIGGIIVIQGLTFIASLLYGDRRYR